MAHGIPAVNFGRGPSYRLGVEEELLLVDPHTHALSHTLGLENVVNDEEDIATVAGLVIAVNGQIPRVGDVIELPPLHITIVEANDYRVDMVRIVKEQSAHDEDE